MTYSKLQEPWYYEDNVALLLSTISVVDTKIGKWNKAGPHLTVRLMKVFLLKQS